MIYVVDFRSYQDVKKKVAFLSKEIKNYKRIGEDFQTIHHAKDGQIFFTESMSGFCG